MVLNNVIPLYRAVCLALAFSSNLILAYCPKLCNRENGLQPTPCEPAFLVNSCGMVHFMEGLTIVRLLFLRKSLGEITVWSDTI